MPVQKRINHRTATRQELQEFYRRLADYHTREGIRHQETVEAEEERLGDSLRVLQAMSRERIKHTTALTAYNYHSEQAEFCHKQYLFWLKGGNKA